MKGNNLVKLDNTPYFIGGRNEDNDETWHERVERFFKGTDHTYYNCGPTSKGEHIIYCNLLDKYYEVGNISNLEILKMRE